MTYLEAILLGIVEGLTEFLPVSSTGHLILANRALGVDPSARVVTVFLFLSQLAAIGAVIVYFWRDLWQMVTSFRIHNWRTHTLTKIGIAFIPSVVLGLAFNDAMETLEESRWGPLVVAIALILGAGAMEWIDRRYRKPREMTIADVTTKQALIVGFCQCLAMIPGTSRSGATIMGGMVVGLSPAVAATLSFYLAIPTMIGAGGLRLAKNFDQLSADDFGVLFVGCLTSFVTALIVVAGFMEFVKRYRFTVFAVYRAILGVVVLIAFSLGWLS